MITLTRFNQTQVTVNAELIETLEATPDTVVTLVTSRKFLVRESVDEVILRVIAYRKAVGPMVLRLDGLQIGEKVATSLLDEDVA